MRYIRYLALMLCAAFAFPFPNAASNNDDSADEDLVVGYVKEHANQTFRSPRGELKYPYLVPAGPYDELWDWDSMFMGIALLEYGSAPYLAGSMKNFLAATNLQTGDVAGCVTPLGPVKSIYHAKPIIIQAAYLAAKNMNDFAQFKEFQPQMEALLSYWRERKDEATGLHVWYDQLESGCDNLVISTCPSNLSPCWDPKIHSLVIAAPDLETFLYRENQAYAAFRKHWGKDELKEKEEEMENIKASMNSLLWNDTLGHYVAYNVSQKEQVTNRVFLMGIPVWANLSTEVQVASIVDNLNQTDMKSEYGIRSTSSTDPRYTNGNYIKPYSNWRGPIWINANAMLAYGLNANGYHDFALEIGNLVIGTLANDIRNSKTWHECFNSENGEGLAAPGFLSWDTLGASLLSNLRTGSDPFLISD